MMENRTLSKRYIKVSQFTLDDIVYKLNVHNTPYPLSNHCTVTGSEKRGYMYFAKVSRPLGFLAWFIGSLGLLLTGSR